MNTYVTGSAIKRLREAKQLTQSEFADQLGNAEARFKRRGRGILYIYCNRHGLMKQQI